MKNILARTRLFIWWNFFLARDQFSNKLNVPFAMSRYGKDIYLEVVLAQRAIVRTISNGKSVFSIDASKIIEARI